MKKLVGFILFVCIFNASAQNFDKDKLDQYFETLEAHEKVMLSVAVVKNGEAVYEKSIGFADVNTKQKANKDTQYRIGSITKVFTSAMIFQLIEEGKLSLNTTLDTFYPKVKNAQEITISMLLNHSSGIYNFTDAPAYSQYMTQPQPKAKMVKLIEGLDSDFKPGSNASYSNSAYVLLGFIIEDITKDTYANQLQKRIASKLSLDRTVYGGPIKLTDNQANSYTRNNGEWLLDTMTDMSIPHGAGALISTPTDVVKFLYNLLAGELISADSLSKMKEVNAGYGRGLFQYNFYDKIVYGHTGGIDGFVARSVYLEEEDLAFVITSNGLNYDMNDISVAIWSIFNGQPYDIPDFDQKPIELSKSGLHQYEGVYASTAIPLKITIKEVGGQLTGQATGQESFNLTAYSTFEFRFDPASIVMVFGANGDSVDYSAFVLKQGAGNYPFTREE
jgi:D-alanyl-D-alanine carboxypeptidase